MVTRPNPNPPKRELRGAPASKAPPTREERRAIVEHGARWASNILVEIIGNHHSVLGAEERACLKRAATALSDFTAAGDR